MTVLATPTPYLRDGLRRLVAGLRKDAETVRLNLAVAEQDVAAARALLAEAEAQHKRAKDAADALTREIAFFEEQAERTPPAYDPDAALAATGLMPREEPIPYAEHVGHRVDVLTTDLERTRGHLARIANGWLTLRTPEGEMSIPDEQVRHVARAEGSLHLEDGDDLTAPGVADSRAQVAPHLPPPVPHDPAGPLMTMPDLAPKRPPLDPPPGEGVHTHAKDRPGLLARLTGGHRTIRDEQDGDQADG